MNKKTHLLILAILACATLQSRGSGFFIHYVATNSPAPLYPYLTWDSAAHTIQEAINACNPGDDVIVTNGVYDQGGAVTPGYTHTNRISVSINIEILSVNGPDVTIIKGQVDPNTGTYGSNAVRCAYINGGASLSGFTLTGGGTVTEPNDIYAHTGAGLFINIGTVSNCIITGNKSFYGGGGLLINHSSALITHTVISSNTVLGFGGGVWFNGSGTLRNCILHDNFSVGSGGGVFVDYGHVENCTIANNRAQTGAAGLASSSIVTQDVAIVNTIIYGNTNQYFGDFIAATSIFNHCLSSKTMLGAGNIVASPGFLAPGDYHLRPGSACVDAGTNLPWHSTSQDFDGQSRIRNGIVDIGADEALQYMAVGMSNSANQVLTSWEVDADGVFMLQYSTNLLSGSWTDTSLVVTSAANRVSVNDTNPVAYPISYRLTRLLP